MFLRVLISFLLFNILLIFSTISTHAGELLKGQEIKAWTLLYYFSGDNNLTDWQTALLSRLEKVSSSADINILVQFDGDKENDSKRLKIYSPLKAEIFEKDIEYDMGDVKTLAGFVAWGIREFPAKRYALAVTAHGRGIINLPVRDGSFLPSSSEEIKLASSPDDTSKSHMEEEELVAALSEVLQDFNEGKKLDLVVYNSCLMGNYGVVANMSRIANWLIATEYPLIVNGSGEFQGDKAVGVPVTDLAKILYVEPNMSTDDLAKELMIPFHLSYIDAGSASVRDGKFRYHVASLAVYDLSKADALTILIRTMLEDFFLLTQETEGLYLDFYKEYIKIPRVDEMGYVDLALMAEAIYKISSLDSAKKLYNYLAQDGGLIYARSLNHLKEWNNSKGLSVYFPMDIWDDESLKKETIYIDFYDKLQISKKSRWNEFIRNYIKAVRGNKFSLYYEFVEDLIYNNKRVQVMEVPGDEGNEEALFRLAEVAFYNLLDKTQFSEAGKYLEMLMGSSYEGLYLEKHKRDIKIQLNRFMKKESNISRKEALKNLIDLLVGVPMEFLEI